jgi:hypothetical protein
MDGYPRGRKAKGNEREKRVARLVTIRRTTTAI